MTLGTGNKKQLYFLGVLGIVAAYLVYDNVLSGPSIPVQQQTAKRPDAVAPQSPIPTAPSGPAAPKRTATRTRSEEVHWVFMPKRPEDRPDPASIDPTLFLDRLKKVQGVDLAGGSRNLFQFSTPPPKPAEAPKGPEPKVAVAKPPEPPKPVVPSGPPPEPPAVPPPYKFYGYSTSRNNGKRTAYFLDGEDILLATEGDTLKRKYKVLRIAPNSVTVEDLDAKKQVSVPLTEESQS